MKITLPVSEDGRPLIGGLDSSTAIILHNAGLLKTFCREWDLVTTDTVLSEIRQGPQGREIEDILDSTCSIEAVAEEQNCEKGENTIYILVCGKKAEAVFSDDRRFLEFCKRENISHYSSIMVPYLLHTVKDFPRDTALDFTRVIITKGRFSEQVLDFVEKLWEPC